MDDVAAQMPRYKCHKQVWALKIADISWKGAGGMLAGAIITPTESGFAPFEVDAAYCSRHLPAIGGYYVVYDDGYKSFSPAKAFEDGYTRL